MQILLTNDDGIWAQGLQTLCQYLAVNHRVSVIAPDRERSAVGHAITLRVPLRVKEELLAGNIRGYAVSGTPADCIKLALKQLLPQRPDLVISGINPGANTGVNTNYSGTVAAAREAALAGIAAMAVSMQGGDARGYTAAARFIEKLARQIQHSGLPQGTFLSINFPKGPPAGTVGVQVSRLANSLSAEHIDKRMDPYNRPYYWQFYNPPADGFEPDTDSWALQRNMVSITPLKCDATDHRFMDELKGWNINF